MHQIFKYKNKATNVLDKSINKYFYNLGMRKGFSHQGYIQNVILNFK